MRLTTGSNRSLRSLGRAKARPLTKRYVPNMQKLLKAYLRNEISKSDLSSAVLDIDGIETRLGRTRYLRLKHGDKRSALDLFQELNECPVCSKLHSENLASSEELFNKLDSLSTRGKIERTQKPAWYEPHLARRNPFGAQAFFKCSECASIIEVCEPERMYRGFCEILG